MPLIILNIADIVSSILCSIFVLSGVYCITKVYKNMFVYTEKYFGKFIHVENFYFTNKKYLSQWIDYFEYILIPVLTIIPGIFITISFIESVDDSLLWLIGYGIQYIIAVILLFIYFKKYIIKYANSIPESTYKYEKFKIIKVNVIHFYNFDILKNKVKIMRNQAFEINFNGFENEYYKNRNNSFKQYRIILKYLARFASIINTIKIEHNWEQYKIVSTTDKTFAYTEKNIVENIILTMQHIVNDIEL